MLYSKIEGQGQPLLILHGYLGMSDNWKTLAGQYVNAGYQVHALDLRNHGRSFHSDEFTYEAMVQDVYDYCLEHNLTNIDLIGHSMGGKVGMFFAMTHPEMLQKLVVADIAPKYYAPHHQDIMAALKAVDFSKKPSRTEVDHIMEPFVPDFGTRQFLMKNLYWKEPDQLAFRFNYPVFEKVIDNIGQELPPASVFEKPTLFLRGSNSNYIKDSDYGNIKKHFPDSAIEVISNAGHWLHAENPKEFFDKTIAFLK
ncbi:alpha/beta fold hydrolase [Flavobacterium sp.]|uniref:alpha/beta fold hydrolase n=1 Tax=Flavobacterium sp. TaxID=239 RepID=UPI0039E5A9FB